MEQGLEGFQVCKYAFKVNLMTLGAERSMTDLCLLSDLTINHLFLDEMEMVANLAKEKNDFPVKTNQMTEKDISLS